MITGVVLAAGRSSRAGCAKALVQLDGHTFVQRAIDVLRAGGCASVRVVVAAPHAEAIASAVTDAVVVHNPTPQRGMLSSLQCGLVRVTGSAVFALVDQPRVSPSTVSALIAAAQGSEAHWLRPVHRGRTGHPILLRRDAVGRLLDAAPSQRVCDVLRACPSESVLVTDPHVVEDFDTPEELAVLVRGNTPAR